MCFCFFLCDTPKKSPASNIAQWQSTCFVSRRSVVRSRLLESVFLFFFVRVASHIRLKKKHTKHNKMTNVRSTQAVMSGLMGIVFGCSIVYIISRLIATQRRVAALEQHITRKADDDIVIALQTRINSMCNDVQNMATEVKQTLDASPKTTPQEKTTPPTSPLTTDTKTQTSTT